MNKLQKTAKIFFIVALIIFLIFSIKYRVNATEDVYINTTRAKQGDVVYFEKPENWGNVTPYIYAWDNYTNPENKLGGNFPGVAMTLVSDNLYKYEFTTDVAYAQLIFSDGNSVNKTEDLDFICNGFVYNNETIKKVEKIAFSMKTLTLGDTVYFEKPTDWNDDVYIYMWNSTNGNSNSDWNNKPSMTHIYENLYSYTLNNTDNNVNNGFDMVVFAGVENGVQKQTKDLSFLGKSLTFKSNNDAISSGGDSGKYDGFWLYNQDKTALSALIKDTTLPADDEIYYTEDSYNIYKEQLDIAKTIVDSTYVAATFSDLTSQYDKSLIALQFAYDNLKIDTKKLSDKISEMKDVNTSKYEQSLVDAFNDSIQDAENLLANPDSITVQKIKEAIANMETSYKNLVVDKTDLKAIIDKAKEIDITLYTDESTKDLLDALTNAIETYENQDASFFDVQEQITRLNDSILKLELKENTNNENTTEKENNTENENTTGKDNNTENEKINDDHNNQEESSITSNNPYTGDIISTLIGVLAIAATVCTSTTIYLRKYKINRKH